MALIHSINRDYFSNDEWSAETHRGSPAHLYLPESSQKAHGHRRHLGGAGQHGEGLQQHGDAELEELKTWSGMMTEPRAVVLRDGSLPGGSRGWAGSRGRREPPWDCFPSPACTTGQEPGTEPADISDLTVCLFLTI